MYDGFDDSILFLSIMFLFLFKIWILNYFIINQVVYKCQYIRSVENEQIKIDWFRGQYFKSIF